MQPNAAQSQRMTHALQIMRCKGAGEPALLALIAKHLCAPDDQARALYDTFLTAFREGAESIRSAQTIPPSIPPGIPPEDHIYRAAYRTGQQSSLNYYRRGTAIVPQRQPSRLIALLGIAVFGFSSSGAALSVNHFPPHININFQTAFLVSLLGGAVGFIIILQGRLLLAILGGVIAGPIAMLATYYYTLHRTHVWTGELRLIVVFAILIASGIITLAEKLLQPDAAHK